MLLGKVDLRKLCNPASVKELEELLQEIKEAIGGIFPLQERQYGLAELRWLLTDKQGRAVHGRLVEPLKLLNSLNHSQRNEGHTEQFALHLGFVLFAQGEPELAKALDL